MNKDLFKKIDFFYKLSIVDISKYTKNVQYAVNLELNVGNKIVDNLLKTNSKSDGLKAIKNIFMELFNLNKQLDQGEYIISQMLNSISKAEFFTSKANVGIGYDYLTNINGATSPSAYLKRIKNHLENLLRLIPKK
jgi:hypothetical protein